MALGLHLAFLSVYTIEGEIEMNMRNIKAILFTGLLQLISLGSHAAEPAFLDIARDASGKVLYMGQSEAVQYCSDRGAHLPSARELAQLSMSLGADGFVDACIPNNHCYKVSYIQNADNSTEEFFFRVLGYHRPAGDLGANWFWSSSVDSKYPYAGFALFGPYGDINPLYRDSQISAVRCVTGR